MKRASGLANGPGPRRSLLSRHPIDLTMNGMSFTWPVRRGKQAKNQVVFGRANTSHLATNSIMSGYQRQGKKRAIVYQSSEESIPKMPAATKTKTGTKAPRNAVSVAQDTEVATPKARATAPGKIATPVATPVATPAKFRDPTRPYHSSEESTGGDDNDIMLLISPTKAAQATVLTTTKKTSDASVVANDGPAASGSDKKRISANVSVSSCLRCSFTA